jgi:hypothetical protein
MTIQVIEKQSTVFRMIINGHEYHYHTPLALYGDDLFELPKRVKGSTLGWSVKGGWVSYNQIKAAIKKAICKIKD